MNINDFRILCRDETIEITTHVFKRCRERNIKLDDIKRCIIHGEIIEKYPTDFPYPSALVLECNVGTPIHVVAGLGDNRLWIITAYHPSSDRWNSDYKTRKDK